ncbi:Crp/Fnr family transcriptional regulator [Novosphingobium sp. SL115]|uniref:Crp/Fnr family transcriptional regulator n=1 Tax=Novosphingobium sp. SL115 TaxID=2995150 RepID=UPI0022743B2D|nr:Crp/Fnr family transcriptional regulator [Novosphingobium sp. SL115]MCY1670156.1 Crp/Fnr family transcriptional regulator [Novosphingobium sp. SL115]
MARDDEGPAHAGAGNLIGTQGLIEGQGTQCAACPLAACPGLRQPPEDLRQWIAAFRQGEARFLRGDHIFPQGAKPRHLYTILSGVLMRTRLLDDGRRQIINFMFPGDFIGLQGALDAEMGHGVEAVTPARLCAFPRERFFDMVTSQPRLAFDLTWLAAHEEAALEEHIVSLGQRNARERMAALAVFLMQRGLDTGMVSEGTLSIGITQSQIADMLGLSLVHTNRTLQALRRHGLVDWTMGGIRVPDMDAVRSFAKIEDSGQSAQRRYI